MRHTILIALTAMLFATETGAASRQAWSRCNDAVRDIKAGPRKLYQGKDPFILRSSSPSTSKT